MGVGVEIAAVLRSFITCESLKNQLSVLFGFTVVYFCIVDWLIENQRTALK